MSKQSLLSFLHYINRSVEGNGPSDQTSDSELIRRWKNEQDETAFELLIWRHAPLVWGVCHRALRKQSDAEDAFQATFLILIRKLGGIRKHSSLASWLYKVALRSAMELRERRSRVLSLDRESPDRDCTSETVEQQELAMVLDEEIHRLPQRFREPFVLCYLEGQTNAQAAELLNCPIGTIASRLSTARERLQKRLTKRGITTTTAAIASFLTQQRLAATVPSCLVSTAHRAAVHFSRGKVNGISSQSILLAKGAIRAMSTARWKLVLCTVLLACLVGATRFMSVTHVEAGPPGGSGISQPRSGERALFGGERRAIAEEDILNLAVSRGGVVKAVGREARKGEAIPEKLRIKESFGTKALQLRKLQKGDRVRKGELLLILDTTFISDEVLKKKAEINAAKARAQATEKTAAEAVKRYRAIQQARKKFPNTASEQEIQGAMLTAQRYEQELVESLEKIKIAEIELRQTLTSLSQHAVYSPANGTIHRILKRPGEGARELETVIQLRLTANSEELQRLEAEIQQLKEKLRTLEDRYRRLKKEQGRRPGESSRSQLDRDLFNFYQGFSR